MEIRQLSSDEAELAELLATIISTVEGIQTKAAAVRSAGGDCRLAFLSVVPDHARPQADMQWPMISMLLGV